jgi:O-antigen ligase
MGTLIGVVLLVLAVRTVTNPFWGLIGLLFITMTNPGELFSVLALLRVERLFVLLVFVSWLMHEKITLPDISRKVLVFWGAMFISIPFAFYKMGALWGFLDFFPVILYHLMIINLVNTADKFRILITTYVSLIGWNSIGALWGYAHGDVYARAARHGLERATALTSFGDDPNSLGVKLVAAIPIIVLLMSQGKTRYRLVGFIVLCATVSALLLTGSRGSFAAMVILVLAFLFTSKKGFMLLPVAVVICAVSWSLIPQKLKDRYLTVTEVIDTNQDEMDESYLSRVYAREAGWAMFKDYPIFGVGAGVFKTASGAEYWPGPGRKRWLKPHNLYIQVLAELGIVGTIAWCVFFYTLVKVTLACKRLFAARDDIDPLFRLFPKACLFSIFVVLVNGYSTHTLYSGPWYFLAAISGALWLIHQPKRQAIPAEAAPWQVPVGSSDKQLGET